MISLVKFCLGHPVFPLSGNFQAEGILHNKTFIMRDVLFKFKATFALINNRFPVHLENLTKNTSALK